MQTDYLKEIGADTGGGGGLLGGTGLEGLEEAGDDSYECILCGKAGLRCVADTELRRHDRNSF